ncbi:MarR family transcriptional regulator [Sphingomonas sp.]|uniref:MarR family winged helix-turn-helix transcriptional regulator n=1 Tax=Sphingomonas sp. TaxID=28214 RepID=UPI001EC849D6|nr:MarR family transcriptional regulator [Sphingomonas sp.]MBX3594803.1 MarR family transcriptional regulator [Sphingomonas sp.]
MSDMWIERVSLPALLRHARGAYGRAMRAALEAEGYDDVPRNGLYVIGGLAIDAEVPLAHLIADLGLSKQAAGQLVDTLVTRGYLDRRVDPQDRRRLVVTLAERGRAAAVAQHAARDRIDALLRDRVGENGVTALRRMLAAIIAVGREDAESAEPAPA